MFTKVYKEHFETPGLRESSYDYFHVSKNILIQLIWKMLVILFFFGICMLNIFVGSLQIFIRSINCSSRVVIITVVLVSFI